MDTNQDRALSRNIPGSIGLGDLDSKPGGFGSILNNPVQTTEGFGSLLRQGDPEYDPAIRTRTETGKKILRPADSAELARLAKEEGADKYLDFAQATYAQESGSGKNAVTSVDGARGGMQIIPATFNRFAKPGESIDNPEDNLRVGLRYIKSLGDAAGGDRAKMAVGYFSGEGNINHGQGSAWKEDRADGNGVRVSKYVNDMLSRLEAPQAASNAPTKPGEPDFTGVPRWDDLIKKPEWASFTPEERLQTKNAYFDHYIAPRVGQGVEQLKQAFMAKQDPVPPQPEQKAAFGVFPNMPKVKAPAPDPIHNTPREALPTDSFAPVKPEVREAFNAAWDAADANQRRLMQMQPGWVGQLSRARAGVYANVDAQGAPSLDAIDTRAEKRAGRIAMAGEDPGFAAVAGQSGAERGVMPGRELVGMSTMRPSEFDFDTKDLFDPNKSRNGLNNELVRGITKGLLGTGKAATGYMQFLGDVYGLDNASSAMRGAGKSMRGIEDAIGERGTYLSRNLEGAINSIVQQLPLMIGGVKAASQAIPLAGMAVQSFGQEYSDGREKGQDIVQATARASLFAAFEVIGERFGLGEKMAALRGAAKGMPSDQIIELLWSALKKEVPGEVLTTTGQFGVDKLGQGVGLNQKATFNDYMKQVADTIGQTVMQSILMGGGTTGVSKAVGFMKEGDTTSLEAQVAAEIARNVKNTGISRTANDEYARALLDPQNYDPRTVDPTDTSKSIPAGVQPTPTPDGRIDPTLDIQQIGDAPPSEPNAGTPPVNPPTQTTQAPIDQSVGQPTEPPPAARLSEDDLAVLDRAEQRAAELWLKSSDDAITPEEKAELDALTAADGDVNAIRKIYQQGVPNVQSNGQAQEPGAASGQGAISQDGQPSGPAPQQEPAGQGSPAQADGIDGGRVAGQQNPVSQEDIGNAFDNLFADEAPTDTKDQYSKESYEEKIRNNKLTTAAGEKPNDSGVFVGGYETISLPNAPKDSHAHLHVLQLSNGNWIAGSDVGISTGGASGSPNIFSVQFKTREEAIAAHAKQISDWAQSYTEDSSSMSTKKSKAQAKAIKNWADSLSGSAPPKNEREAKERRKKSQGEANGTQAPEAQQAAQEGSQAPASGNPYAELQEKYNQSVDKWNTLSAEYKNANEERRAQLRPEMDRLNREQANIKIAIQRIQSAELNKRLRKDAEEKFGAMKIGTKIGIIGHEKNDDVFWEKTGDNQWTRRGIGDSEVTKTNSEMEGGRLIGGKPSTEKEAADLRARMAAVIQKYRDMGKEDMAKMYENMKEPLTEQGVSFREELAKKHEAENKLINGVKDGKTNPVEPRLRTADSLAEGKHDDKKYAAVSKSLTDAVVAKINEYITKAAQLGVHLHEVDSRMGHEATGLKAMVSDLHGIFSRYASQSLAIKAGYKRANTEGFSTSEKDLAKALGITLDQLRALASEPSPSALESDMVGQDSTPMNEGGKPFKTKDAAKKEQKNHPDKRVVKVDGGYALAPKTEAQIKAQEAAAKRLGTTGNKGMPEHAHGYIATHGGLSKSHMADLGFDKNQRVGSLWLFRDGGMSLERATESLIEAGYLKEGASHNDAITLIQKSIRTPQYTPEGWERIGQMEDEQRFEDHLAAQEELAQEDPEYDPFAPLEEKGYTPEYAAENDYDERTERIKLEVNALSDQAEAAGLDVDTIKEQAFDETSDKNSDGEYQANLKRLLEKALEGSDRTPGGNDDLQNNGRDESGGQAAQSTGQEESLLNSYSPEEVLANEERKNNAEALDQKDKVDAEVAHFGLNIQPAEDKRKDTTGDIFGGPKAQDVQANDQKSKSELEDQFDAIMGGQEGANESMPKWLEDLQKSVGSKEKTDIVITKTEGGFVATDKTNGTRIASISIEAADKGSLSMPGMNFATKVQKYLADNEFPEQAAERDRIQKQLAGSSNRENKQKERDAKEMQQLRDRETLSNLLKRANDAGATELASKIRQAITSIGHGTGPKAVKEIEQRFAEDLRKETGQGPKTEKEAKEQRTATQAAASAAVNVASAADKALSGLATLFGGKPGTFNSGLGFDEETYAQAKPMFLDAIGDLQEAKKDILEAMRTMVDKILKLVGGDRNVVIRMKPYVVRFIDDVQKGVIDKEIQDANAPGKDSQQDSRDSKNEKPSGSGPVSDGPSKPGQIPGGSVSGTSQGGQRPAGGQRVSGNGTPNGGERGNKPIHNQDGRLDFEDDPARNSEQEGSSQDSRDGHVSDPGAEDGAVPVAPLKERLAAQKAANNAPVVQGDADNIKETLPLLMPSQQEDVLFAEKRLMKTNGYGVLFTNGTGTGKTYLGLGIIKRMVNSGKKTGLIVVPGDAVANEWLKSAPNLGLTITKLENMSSPVRGVMITTYANLAGNPALADTAVDFLIADEAQMLMANSSGEVTSALESARAMTLHPDSARTRTNMIEREAVKRIELNRERVKSLRKIANLDDTMDEMRQSYLKEARELEEQIDKDQSKWNATYNKQIELVKNSQNESRPRAVFLSATPFAYEQNTKWAGGFLFDYGEPSKAYQEGRRDAPNPQQAFMMRHFGWRMRNDKLTEPGAGVDRGLMQVQFNTWMRKEGVLSARMLEVDQDYDRKFVLIEGGIGTRIDQAMKWLRESNGGMYRMFYDSASSSFDYLSRSRLLEAIKAKAAIPYIKAQHALGRKVVVFYDYNEGGSFNPFNFGEDPDGTRVIKTNVFNQETNKWDPVEFKFNDFMAEFNREFSDLLGSGFQTAMSPLDTLTEAFPKAGVYNGQSHRAKTRQADIDNFNNDEMPEANLLIVQSSANAGWSGHDTSGKHQRVLINLGLPVAPTKAIQQEGRIYRVGQMSNAIFRYFNTGTLWERLAFATKVARRASTAENLAMGEDARGLLQSFMDAFLDSGDYQPTKDEGTGGKKLDRALAQSMTDFDRAKTFYWAQQKKNQRTKAQEGKDYYATPEPIGLKMVEWLHLNPNESALEPSAGHGAIARWFPDSTIRTVVEDSSELASALALTTDAKLINDKFEALHISNKYHGIAMNPPFGVGGKTAMEHLDKAFRHLESGGRMVAIIPEGPSANQRFDDWFSAKDDKGRLLLPTARLIADISLPGFTFNRAGTGVRTRILVIDKVANKDVETAPATKLDLSGTKDIAELFSRIEHIDFPRTPVPATAKLNEPGNRPTLTPGEPGTSVDTEDRVKLGGKEYPIAVYTSNNGKAMRGVWLPSKDAAMRFTDRTFYKQKLGWFVYESKLPAGSKILENIAGRPSWSSSIPEGVRANALSSLQRLEKKLSEGKITDAEYRLGVQQLISKLQERNDAREDRRDAVGRRRGADWIISKLRRGVADGIVPRNEADFAEWLLDQNPNIANDLGIRLTAKDGNGASGNYSVLGRVATLFVHGLGNDTTVHEILHHAERMMPGEVQDGIVKEWQRAWADAYKKADETKKAALRDMIAASMGDIKAQQRLKEAYANGVLSIDEYQLSSPSEFWAVNGTRILSNRYNARGSWVSRAIQWTKEFFQKAKAFFGLRSDAPIFKALDAVLRGDGTFQTNNMLVERDFKSWLANLGQEQTPDLTILNATANNNPGQYQMHGPAQQPGGPIPNTAQIPLGAPGGQNTPSWMVDDMGTLDKFIYAVQDRQINLKRVQEAISEVSAIPEQFDAYQREELYHGRVAARTHKFLDREVKPLLMDMKLKGVSLDELEAYLWARHAAERNAQIAAINPKFPDGGSGLTDAEAAAYMSGVDVLDQNGEVVIKGLDPAKHRLLQQLAARVDAIRRGTNQILMQYGLEDPNTIAAWDAAYQFYVPLQREEMDGSTPIGRGYSVKGSSTKRATGSSRMVVDILANMVLQREVALTRGEKNRVAQSLYGLVSANPNPDFWELNKPPMKAVTDPATGLIIYKPDLSYYSHDNVVVVRLGGKDRAISFNKNDKRAKATVEVLKNLDINGLDGALNIVSKATRYFASINTQYNPVFGMVNGMRDVQTALLALTNTPLAGKQFSVLANVGPAIKAVFKIERHGQANNAWDQLYEDMKMHGGTTGYREMFRTGADRAEALEKEIKHLDAGWPRKSAEYVLDLLDNYNTAIENATRLAVYKVAIDSGMSKDKAASIAKNITVNFNRKGSWARGMGVWFAFYNAAVQGTTNGVKVLRGPAGARIIAGGLLIGMLQSIAGHMAFGDDDWEDIPDFLKARNFIIPAWKGKHDKRHYGMLPMPLFFNMLPGIGRILTDSFLAGGKHMGKRVVDLFSLIMDNVNPLGSSTLAQTISPTIADPIVALAENKDFSGREIYKEDANKLQPKPGHARARDSSSHVARALARGINWIGGGTDYTPSQIPYMSPTPDQIDYIFGTLTGGLGREINKAYQTAELMLKGQDVPEHRKPLVGRFFGSTDEDVAVSSRFWTNVKDLNMLESEINGRRRDHISPSDFRKENPESKLIAMGNHYERMISGMRADRHKFEFDPKITEEVRTQKLKERDERITDAMRKFNTRVAEVKREAKEAAK